MRWVRPDPVERAYLQQKAALVDAAFATGTIFGSSRIEWLDDDHAMVSQESLQQRWDYIDEVLKAI